MDIGFNTIQELYDRVYPALKNKKKEFYQYKIDYIKEEDIWNCLVDLRWKKKKGLMLSDIVDDILKIRWQEVDAYLKQQMKTIEREAQMNIEII